MFTKLFWRDAGERALATAAQSMLTIITVYVPAISLASTGDLQAGIIFTLGTLPYILLAGLGGAAFSLIKSIAAAYKTKTESASLSTKVAENNTVL